MTTPSSQTPCSESTAEECAALGRDEAPPRTLFARGSILGKSVARASMSQLKHRLSKPFRSEQARAQSAQRADEETARILFDACGALRGTALKLAQVLAMEPEMLPQAYRDEFARAAHRAPPISRALVRKIVQLELGCPETRFHSFAPTPFAAASLGQVHAAVSHQGEQLAVKVQYPGMAESVRSDLLALKLLLRPSRLARHSESCLEELRSRLEEELDYRHEAAHTSWFRENLRLPEVTVPKVLEELTTAHVITTERIAGLHLTDWLATGPSQRVRNRFGQLLVDLFHHCLFDLRCIHADPNFGNYLFREDGQLALLDFGCVKRFPVQAMEVLRQLFEGPPCNAAEVEQLHASIGIHYRNDVSSAARREFLIGWSTWLALPFRRHSFDFGANQDYFDRGDELSRQARRYLERYDGSFLYLGRTHHGLLRLLQALGAVVSMNRSRSPNGCTPKS